MASSNKTEQRAFIFLLLVLLAVGLYLISPFVHALILGGVFTVLFYPLHKRYLKWTQQRLNLSAMLSTISVVLFLFIPVAVLLTLVTTQLASLVASANISITENSFSGLVDTLQRQLTALGVKIQQFTGLHFELLPTIQKAVAQLAQVLADYSPSVLSGTANFFLQFFLMIIVLFYLFRDGKGFLDMLIRISPVKDQYERRLAGEIQKTIYGVFYGNFLAGLIQAVVATIGYYFAGVQAYIIWGIVTFFVSFIPVLGTAVVIVPLALVLMIQGHLKAAIFLLVYSVTAVGLIDNLLRPILIRSNMHPLVLFLSIFGGVAVFGPLGIVFGPMLLALLTATVRIYSKDFTGVELPSK